jgi:LruC domain-containing protein
MISNLRRGYEIHLPDNPPTSLADQSIFNTGNDKSNAALGRFYRSDRNIPWAINVPENYPIIMEKNQIINAYLKFENWCQSGGLSYNDWYENKTGYRDDSKLLNR